MKKHEFTIEDKFTIQKFEHPVFIVALSDHGMELDDVNIGDLFDYEGKEYIIEHLDKNVRGGILGQHKKRIGMVGKPLTEI